MNRIGFFLLVLGAMLSMIRGHVLKIEDLEHFYDLEDKLVVNFKTYIQQQESILKLLKQRYESHKQTRASLKTTDPDHYLANPLNVHALVRRLIAEWPLTLALLNDAQSIVEEDSLPTERLLPTPKEYTEAVHGISRIQHVYNINITDLINGTPFPGTAISSHLTGGDCYAIGEYLYESHHYAAAVDWFKEALKWAERAGNNGGEPTEQILEYLALAACFKGNRKQSNYYFQELYMTYTSYYPTQHLLKDHLRVMNENCIVVSKSLALQQTTNINIPDISSNEKKTLTVDYNHLCRTHGSQRPSNSLRCHLHSLLPFLHFRPVRIEILNENPPIAMLHDVIHPSEIQLITETIKLKDQGLKDERRTNLSNVAVEVQQVLRRVVMLTGLVPHHAQSLTLSSYAVSTEQLLHHDTNTTKEESLFGDRVASLMLYLQEPDKGGELVFPKLKLSVAPNRGSAVLWYNLHRNGQHDDRAIYGACPVLQGHKSTVSTWLMDSPTPQCSVVTNSTWTMFGW